jgi:hypothetical protein
MSGPRITILVAGDDSNCLAKLIGPLPAEQFRVVNVARSETAHFVLLDLKSPFDVFIKGVGEKLSIDKLCLLQAPSPGEEIDSSEAE